MKTIIAGVLMVCLLAICIPDGATLAAPPDNYTAKMVVHGMTMPMAKMANKMRVENPMMQGIVTVTLTDAKKMVMMSTANKTYMEQPLQEDVPSVNDPRAVVEKKKVGSETIDGHPCVKYDAVYYLKDKPNEKHRATIWEAQDLGGLAIRNEMMVQGKGGGGETKVVTELKEIKVGAASASMFEVPSDYRKVNGMMELMGGTEKMKEMMKQKKK